MIIYPADFSVMEEQMKAVLQSMQLEASLFYKQSRQLCAARARSQDNVVAFLRSTLQSLWSFADVVPFGSHATGLSSTTRLHDPTYTL